MGYLGTLLLPNPTHYTVPVPFSTASQQISGFSSSSWPSSSAVELLPEGGSCNKIVVKSPTRTYTLTRSFGDYIITAGEILFKIVLEAEFIPRYLFFFSNKFSRG